MPDLTPALPLAIQGQKLEDLVQNYGQPLYVYDAQSIENQIKRLKNAFAQVPLQIKYAVKALSNLNILRLMRQQGLGLDTVSIEEVALGLKAGFEPSEILYTPNCVSFEEIQEAVRLGVVINLDNISMLERFGHAYGGTVGCCLRLNPHIMAGGNHKISTGHIDSKFGISILQLRHVLRIVKQWGIQVIGLHVHTGSDILDTDVFLRAADMVFEAAMDFPDLAFLDFGSGFKIAYKPNDITTDVEELGAKLSEAFLDFCQRYGRTLALWFEPGKFLVSEAGYLLAKVNVIKTTPATVFVGINSGLNHLIRPMMYDAYHHITNLSNPEGPLRIYTVVGYICETDTFGWDRRLNEVREGDVLCLHNAGAYGFSMSSQYNGRLRPAEVLIENGQARLIRKRESLADLLQNQILD